MSIFSKRLKEARREAGLSQERLGVLAGIDEMSASARMNQYERGKHEPDFSMVERIARALKLPASFFYAEDDDEARLLRWFCRLDKDERAEVMRMVSTLQG
ncbi:MAG: helix-turn-helix domain-containing protein [Betaproteobacteria bacterium]|nr:helix-turn-helix domain-containing protein [Betaproteobacteria bacterium]MCL2885649.1 helix-turn-helix domain-containing protein [Betaproteobacteria bacterium]